MEKDRKRNHPKGCRIILMEMIQMLLLYSEVIINMNFIQIQTTPLELGSGSERVCKTNNIVNNGVTLEIEYQEVREEKTSLNSDYTLHLNF